MRLISVSGVFPGLWSLGAGVYKWRVFLAYFGPGSYALARCLWCGKLVTDADYAKRGFTDTGFKGRVSGAGQDGPKPVMYTVSRAYLLQCSLPDQPIMLTNIQLTSLMYNFDD